MGTMTRVMERLKDDFDAQDSAVSVESTSDVCAPADALPPEPSSSVEVPVGANAAATAPLEGESVARHISASSFVADAPQAAAQPEVSAATAEPVAVETPAFEPASTSISDEIAVAAQPEMSAALDRIAEPDRAPAAQEFNDASEPIAQSAPAETADTVAGESLEAFAATAEPVAIEALPLEPASTPISDEIAVAAQPEMSVALDPIAEAKLAPPAEQLDNSAALDSDPQAELAATGELFVDAVSAEAECQYPEVSDAADSLSDAPFEAIAEGAAGGDEPFLGDTAFIEPIATAGGGQSPVDEQPDAFATLESDCEAGAAAPADDDDDPCVDATASAPIPEDADAEPADALVAEIAEPAAGAAELIAVDATPIEPLSMTISDASTIASQFVLNVPPEDTKFAEAAAEVPLVAPANAGAAAPVDAARGAPQPEVPTRAQTGRGGVFEICTLSASRVDASIVAIRQRFSPLCEQFRAAAARLLSLNPVGQPQSIAIASSLPREGRSVFAANLALILAEGGHRRVILVDADLRGGSLASLLGASSELGVAEILAGEALSDDALQATSIDNLQFLSAGRRADRNPADLLGGPRLGALIRELRTRADYVLIDTPAVLTSADASVIAPHCDGALLLIAGGRTNESFVSDAVQTLRGNNVNLLGCILTACEDRSASLHEHRH